MKRILLSILFIVMIAFGILGSVLEGAIIYDHLNGEIINTRLILSSTGSEALKNYAQIACEYVEEGRINELREIYKEKGLRFAIYSTDGTPQGRYMSIEEENMAVRVYVSTEQDDYIVKLNALQMKLPNNNEIVTNVWLFFYGNIVFEIALGLISVLLLVTGTVLFVMFAPPMCKYLLLLGFLIFGNIQFAEMYEMLNPFVRVAILLAEAILLIVLGAVYISKIKTLHNAVEQIAEGNIDCNINTKKYPISLKGFAGDIAKVSESVSLAVNERLKSERLKTELITNISHDIKTPLTSIINFSDLINKGEATEEEKAEYANHLHKQSVRLKELLESLIEASKAATGAVEINLSPCDVHILLEQCVVEYEHKLNEAEITLMESYPEDKLMISADAKFLSRIFENLLTNICKYSMPGSRAYVNAAQKEDRVVISFKNMSRDPLNFSMEELTERFVRGDLSRHSEGHGLGLSIVKSLMDLQNGTLNMYAEADLFVAELSFPILKEE